MLDLQWPLLSSAPALCSEWRQLLWEWKSLWS